MDVWLLGAGAIVLIALTVWLVYWPTRGVDPLEAPIRDEEVSQTPMTETTRPDLVPQGDRFEDQYTSATADLSAGGVAAAVESMQSDTTGTVQFRPATPTTGSSAEPWASPTMAREGFAQSTTSPAPQTSMFARPRTLGIGGSALLALGGAIGGAYLYARWQRERNKPINRLRRGAHDVASRLSDRIPDVVDDLPGGPAPIGGAASALLLAALIGSRALRRGDDESRQAEVRDQFSGLLKESMREARRRGLDTIDSDKLKDSLLESVTRGRQVARKTAEQTRHEVDRAGQGKSQRGLLGLGFGGIAVVVGGVFVIWRLLRGGGGNRQPNWYTGE